MGAAALAVAVAGIVVVSSSSGEAPAAGGKTSQRGPADGGAAPETAVALPQAGVPRTAPPGPVGADGRRTPMVAAGLDGAGSGAPAGDPGGAAREPAAEEPGTEKPGTGEAPERKDPAVAGEADAGKPGSREPGGDGNGKPEKKSKKAAKGGEAEAAGRSKHTDAGAVAYFQRSKAAKRVKDIRMVGGYLRIYTDLPESADNSKQAIELCETGLDYLAEEIGEDDPVVFVQAEFGENGNPVLANVLGPDDSTCRVTYPRPGR
ncbi:hypothetical protein Ppa06_44890 [Planomonospora parontospora subsp. parontospora]|uniref:Translation initiation factor IF-2 n=3 Tax=Planomonospora parontospora TaxID=58119 RepID=A0AA37F6Z0_9ACTN|nr:hypothetical protein [Planomonospora parontospora]GGK85351.1 hypothetical protein GCM10010126_50750 [Planomonospora parontospora]GII10691.1 hypothetical protein Ppa06_44890 [Planomonospora parontospora subsp. parontospora]